MTCDERIELMGALLRDYMNVLTEKKKLQRVDKDKMAWWFHVWRLRVFNLNYFMVTGTITVDPEIMKVGRNGTSRLTVTLRM